MTRQEFIDNVEDFNDLLYFCSDEDYNLEYELVSGYDLSERIDDDIREAIRHESWTIVRDWLNDIVDDGEWYARESMLGYRVLEDSDFDDAKQEILDWYDRHCRWDDPEDEDEAAPDSDDEPEDVPEDDFGEVSLEDSLSVLSEGAAIYAEALPNIRRLEEALRIDIQRRREQQEEAVQAYIRKQKEAAEALERAQQEEIERYRSELHKFF